MRLGNKSESKSKKLSSAIAGEVTPFIGICGLSDGQPGKHPSQARHPDRMRSIWSLQLQVNLIRLFVALETGAGGQHDIHTEMAARGQIAGGGRIHTWTQT